MNRLILGIDPGNDKAKIVGPFGVDSYNTNICDWFERDVEETFGKDDMEFQIGNRKGYAGTIAKYEDDYGSGSMYGDSKAHEETKIRVLLAIYRYLKRYCPHYERLAIVTGQPIISHKGKETKVITDMLEGYHEFIVDKRKVSFTIEHVGVVPEGSAAFWSDPVQGKIRILDCGSATINAATIIDNHHITNASGTFNFGMETVKNKNDLAGIARGIVRNTTSLKWHREDTVFICGGVAAGIEPFLREHYHNAKLLQPRLNRGDGYITLDPVYANAAGYYVMAKGAFG